MRIRSIKPEFFQDEQLAELPAVDRLVFVGLWAVADKAGRLEDRPKRIKALVVPYDEVDIEAVLDRLERARFILRYQVDALHVIQIRSWDKHQRPHHTEVPSVLPPHNGGLTVVSPLAHGNAPVSLDHGSGNGSGKGTRTSTHVDVAPVCDGFDEFWGAYPRHEGKAPAQTAWRRLRPTAALRVTIAAALVAQRAWPTWREPRFIPHAAAWLHQRRWEDERPADHSPPRTRAPGAQSGHWCEHDPPCHHQQEHIRRTIEAARAALQDPA